MDFFNSFGLPLGTWIAIIISAITFISGLIISIKKVKKKYDAKLKKRLAKQEEDRKFKSSMKSLVLASCSFLFIILASFHQLFR